MLLMIFGLWSAELLILCDVTMALCAIKSVVTDVMRYDIITTCYDMDAPRSAYLILKLSISSCFTIKFTSFVCFEKTLSVPLNVINEKPLNVSSH